MAPAGWPGTCGAPGKKGLSVARRPSTHQQTGQLRGIIIVVQESRFRLVDEAGHGYLLTLSKHANVTPEQLTGWAARRTPVVVEFTGEPDYATGVATRLLPARVTGKA